MLPDLGSAAVVNVSGRTGSGSSPVGAPWKPDRAPPEAVVVAGAVVVRRPGRLVRWALGAPAAASAAGPGAGWPSACRPAVPDGSPGLPGPRQLFSVRS